MNIKSSKSFVGHLQQLEYEPTRTKVARAQSTKKNIPQVEITFLCL